MATTAKKKGKKSTPIELNVGQTSWATEMENSHINTTLIYKSDVITATFPSAPRGAFDTEYDFSHVPERPPYFVSMKNLPYEVSKDNIEQFFNKLNVTNVKLPEKNVGKAVGCAEFKSRNDLIEALKKNKEKILGREIYIELANSLSQENKFNGSNWRDDSNNKYQKRGSDYTAYNITGRNRNNDYGSRNGLNAFPPNPGFNSGYQPPPSNRRPAYMGSVSSDFSGNINNRYPNYNGNFSRLDGPQNSLPSQPRGNNVGNIAGYERKETVERRPTLDLKPRTKSIKPEEANLPAIVDPKKHASIFGGAKPVDTSNAEAKIEALLEKQEMIASAKKSVLPKISTRSTSQSSDQIEENYEENEAPPINIPPPNRGNLRPQNYYPPPRSSQPLPPTQTRNDFPRRPSQQTTSRYGLPNPSNPMGAQPYGPRPIENGEGRNFDLRYQQAHPPRYQGARSVDYGTVHRNKDGFNQNVHDMRSAGSYNHPSQSGPARNYNQQIGIKKRVDNQPAKWGNNQKSAIPKGIGDEYNRRNVQEMQGNNNENEICYNKFQTLTIEDDN